MYSIYWNRNNIWATKLLLKQKGVTANPKNNHGETPLHYSSRKGNQEIIKILTENGGDTSVIREFGKRMILKNLYNRYFEWCGSNFWSTRSDTSFQTDGKESNYSFFTSLWNSIENFQLFRWFKFDFILYFLHWKFLKIYVWLPEYVRCLILSLQMILFG